MQKHISECKWENFASTSAKRHSNGKMCVLDPKWYLAMRKMKLSQTKVHLSIKKGGRERIQTKNIEKEQCKDDTKYSSYHWQPGYLTHQIDLFCISEFDGSFMAYTYKGHIYEHTMKTTFFYVRPYE